ncbi:MAG TPA: PAS domain S-box protein [Thermoanaerobaculia bacterium]
MLKPEPLPEPDERDLAAAALDHLGDLVLVLDRVGRIVRFNKECERVTGFTASEVIGRPLWSLLASPEEADSLRAVFANLTPAHFPNRQESRLRTREGEPRLIAWANTALLDGRGEVEHVLSAGTDITERRWAEEDLLRTNQALRTLIESSPLAISVLDREGLVRAWNPAAERIFGWSRKEVLGRLVPSVPEARREEFLDNLRRTFEGRPLSGVETVRQRKDGTLIDVELWISVLHGPQGEPESLVSMINDISDRKRAQEALRLREEQLRLITDSVPALISYIDTGLCYRFVNRQYEVWFGLPRNEVYGRTMREVLGDKAYETIRHYVEAALAGQEVTYETWISYQSGGTRFIHVTYAPHREDGEVRGIFVLVSDLTDRKQAEEELRAAKEAVEAASRAKDHFLAVLSHELRTPLTPVLATISALEADESLRRNLRDSLAMIRRNVELEARLIDDLLDLTRIARGKLELHPESVDVQQILHHAVNISCVQEVAAGRLRLEMGIAPGDYKLRADGPRLTQVFWNLLNNAVKFTPPGGLITVRSRIEEGETGRSFVAEISDTGIGIEPERLSRVFDAFEQTDRRITRRFGGLGLGLAVSKAILELHGGSLTASSEGIGRGATFTVRLPGGHLVDLDETLVGFPLPQGIERPVAPRPDRPLRILLVEDHADTAEAMADLLRILDYEVAVAGSVAAGLSVAEEACAAGGIDLVVSDLGLPDGSGHDLMRELVRRHGLKGIALSGYGMEEDVRKSLAAGFSRHLTKPVTLQALKTAIQQALGLDAPESV